MAYVPTYRTRFRGRKPTYPAGDTNPVTNGLRIDMDAAKGVTLNSSTVSAWANQGSMVNSANQGTGGQQPLFLANALNGFPGVKFDGVDDNLQYTSAISDTVATIFMVVVNCNPASSAANGLLLSLDRLALMLNDPGAGNGWGCYAQANVSSGVVLTAAAHVLSNVARAPNDQDLVTDGVLVNKTSGGPSYDTRGGSAVGNNVGGGLPVAATILRVLLYDHALTNGERKSVEQYLGAKYGVAVAP